MRKLKALIKAIRKTAYLMMGIPDYQVYVAHQKKHHPEQPIMSYEIFFREQQKALYGKNKSKCC